MFVVRFHDGLHCNDSETNDGTDAKYEMETWASPDTNRTDITKLICRIGGMIVVQLLDVP